MLRPLRQRAWLRRAARAARGCLRVLMLCGRMRAWLGWPALSFLLHLARPCVAWRPLCVLFSRLSRWLLAHVAVQVCPTPRSASSMPATSAPAPSPCRCACTSCRWRRSSSARRPLRLPASVRHVRFCDCGCVTVTLMRPICRRQPLLDQPRRQGPVPLAHPHPPVPRHPHQQDVDVRRSRSTAGQWCWS